MSKPDGFDARYYVKVPIIPPDMPDPEAFEELARFSRDVLDKSFAAKRDAGEIAPEDDWPEGPDAARLKDAHDGIRHWLFAEAAMRVRDLWSDPDTTKGAERMLRVTSAWCQRQANSPDTLDAWEAEHLERLRSEDEPGYLRALDVYGKLEGGDRDRLGNLAWIVLLTRGIPQ